MAENNAATELLKKINEILKKYNNEESNIPMTSEYWKLVNDYRAALRG